MATSGQTLNDRINAARYALAGQGVARCVCKATTEEVIGPKKKHLDYLLACTHEPNVSIPQLANLLIERTKHNLWVVVFKALVTVHHLMSNGNERFFQYIASSNYSFELSTFLDKTTTRDFTMSTYIRRYSRYINEKALSYRSLAFDFCKVKRGKDGILRLMPIERLLKTLPILQDQLDALLEFDCNANDLKNGIINACFMLLFRDLIGLFACHNDGIINLLEKYFTLNKRMCREAFEMYRRFLIRMDKVSDFLRVAEAVGIDKVDIPDIRRTPHSLLDALEQHLLNLESNKKILKQQQQQGSAIEGLTPPSNRRPSSPATPGSSLFNSNSNNNLPRTVRDDQSEEFATVNNLTTSTTFRDDEVRKALEEEARVLSQYGNDGMKNIKSSHKSSNSQSETAPKTVGVPTKPKTIDDIFGDTDSFGVNNNTELPTNNINNNNNNSNIMDNNNRSNLSSQVLRDLSFSNSTTTATKTSTPPSNICIKPPPSSNNSFDKLASSQANNKKASDDLFSLLDNPKTTSSADLFSAQVDLTNLNLSSVTTNGNQKPPSHIMKPGNPFPDASNDFVTSFPPMGNASQLPSVQQSAQALIPGTLLAPSKVASPPSQSTGTNQTVFKSGTSTANYTNLGGFDGGFGDFLSNSQAGNANKSSKPNFTSTGSSSGLFKGDLDSTLASLAQNLTFDGAKKK